jgi:cytochrome c
MVTHAIRSLLTGLVVRPIERIVDSMAVLSGENADAHIPFATRKRVAIFSLALLLIMVMPPISLADGIGTRDEAIAMVKRVQEKFAKDGPEATFAAVTARDREFHDRDLYPFIYRLDGVNVAHGARPALVGKNLLRIKDPDGIPLIRMMAEIANGPGSGWIDYKWPSPITNAIEDKTSYIEKMGDYFVGVGVYR